MRAATLAPPTAAPGADRPRRWDATRPGRLTLAVPGGEIVLEHERGEWSATLHRDGRPPLVIASGLPMAYARQTAEDLARRMDGAARHDERIERC